MPGAWLRVVLLVVAALALAIPTLVVLNAATIRHVRVPKLRIATKVVPPTVLPPVEPVEFVDLAPDDARAFNASVPFSRAPIPAARPFRLAEDEENRARATDCLATAVLYEAGADPEGQRAVAQVVVNRIRHPAFPKTVCGVVFEGQERRTGCQFSFSCDGALTRWTPPEALWAAARKIAAAALSGTVYRKVGYATHYHTDWVVPYWQSSLDKIAAVHSHLFFRWSGWWGTPPAFNRRVVGAEPVIAAIAPFSGAHKTGAALEEATGALAESAMLLMKEVPQPLASDPTVFLVSLPKGLAPDAWPQLAALACGDRPICKFSAWSDSAPTTAPLEPAQVATMTFSYLRDRGFGFERTLWNCRTIKRLDPRGCMRQQVLAAPVAGPLPTATPPPQPPSQPSAARVGPELTGVRRTGVGSDSTKPTRPAVAREATAPDSPQTMPRATSAKTPVQPLPSARRKPASPETAPGG
ncbi:cell wall hydrolase [Sphingomonas sp. Leaf343]|uniref:cell wall hydrolase n=1 Tax=Sphingomonas sp. Leaf343 TaxID=1736345 RepID=UPI0012E318E7|nr:cell wall hydrolase [Sphingomonas sp. Leaf343]